MKTKTFVVNLKDSVDRRSFMEAQLKFFPELDITFFDAIDARKFTKSDIDKVYNDIKAKQVINRSMSKGEIGVAMSQLTIMKKIAVNYDFGLIMEDDLLISPYFSESLEIAVKTLESSKPQIILFTPIPYYSAIAPVEINKLQNRYIYKPAVFYSKCNNIFKCHNL